jgi:hypothetical protein
VNLGQLKKKVAKEFAKSPAKTITLIALCPVALYFIVPLLLPKKPKIDEEQRIKVIATDIQPTTTLATGAALVLPVSIGPTWEQLIRWIDADVRRKSGSIATDQRNPFQAPVVAAPDIVEDGGDPPEDTFAPPEFTQETFVALGIKLTGIVLGRHTRSATINGKRYVEGAEVSPIAEHVFVLTHVAARMAILELDGAQFRLKLDSSGGRDNGITVVRRQASSPN